MGIIVGMVVTAIIQSSSATTVMVVGFVNAGLMTLEQSIGVILGANIGTTITAQMVAFKLEKAALPAIALGMLISILGKKKVMRGLADTILGFGILFLGIMIMGDALAPLKTYQPFIDLMVRSQDCPALGILLGAAFTVLVQSSSATTALLVTLALRGAINLGAALPLVFGAAIGTTSTAIIASFGATLAAKRAALAHFMFNVFGTLIFLPLLKPFESLAAMTSISVARQIANAHTMMKITEVFIVLPFINQFADFIRKLLKGTDNMVEHGPIYLDTRLIATPFSALIQINKEVIRMAKLCLENVKSATSLFMGDTLVDVRRLTDIEQVIDEIEEAIAYYVAKVSQQDVTADQAKSITSVINVTADLERVGDHAISVVELSEYKEENNLIFSDMANQELEGMIALVLEILEKAIESFEKSDKHLANSIRSMDDSVDEMEKELRKKHIQRLNQGICYPASGVVYLDLLSHLERIGDHAVNIAEAVLEQGK